MDEVEADVGRICEVARTPSALTGVSADEIHAAVETLCRTAWCWA